MRPLFQTVATLHLSKKQHKCCKSTEKKLFPACNIRLHWFLVRIRIYLYANELWLRILICLWLFKICDSICYLGDVFFLVVFHFYSLVGNRHLHKNFEPTVWLRYMCVSSFVGRLMQIWIECIKCIRLIAVCAFARRSDTEKWKERKRTVFVVWPNWQMNIWLLLCFD